MKSLFTTLSLFALLLRGSLTTTEPQDPLCHVDQDQNLRCEVRCPDSNKSCLDIYGGGNGRTARMLIAVPSGDQTSIDNTTELLMTARRCGTITVPLAWMNLSKKIVPQSDPPWWIPWRFLPQKVEILGPYVANVGQAIVNPALTVNTSTSALNAFLSCLIWTR